MLLRLPHPKLGASEVSKNACMHFELSAQLPDAAGGRCVFLLEGGYDLKALGEAVADTFTGLLGDASIDKFNADLLRDEPRDKADRLFKDAIAMHSL